MSLLKIILTVAFKYKQLSLSIGLILLLFVSYNTWMSSIKKSAAQQGVTETIRTVNQQAQKQVKTDETIIADIFDPPSRNRPNAIDERVDRMFSVTENTAQLPATITNPDYRDRDRLQRPRNDPVDSQRRPRNTVGQEDSEVGLPDRLRAEEIDFINAHASLLQ